MRLINSSDLLVNQGGGKDCAAIPLSRVPGSLTSQGGYAGATGARHPLKGQTCRQNGLHRRSLWNAEARPDVQ
jgi:hypothetical protein